MKQRKYHFKARYMAYVYEEFDIAADTDDEAEEKAYNHIEYLSRMDKDAVDGNGEILEYDYEKAYAFMDEEE